MLGKLFKLLFTLTFLVSVLCGPAVAGSGLVDPRTGAPVDCPPEYKGISKVRPASATPVKVKPYRGYTAGFGGLSRWNPMTWGGPTCCLPGPARGQFEVGADVFFARLNGDAIKGFDQAGFQTSVVDFDDHLGLKKSGNVVWSVKALYQFRPRWGIRYSFTPIETDATHMPQSAFTFMNRSFAANTQVRSKFERHVHRAGLVFNISRKVASTTNFFAEWMYVQDRLSVGDAQAGGLNAASWDDNKNLAMLGVEFKRCLKNFKGNTLAIGTRAGIAFLDDTIGYDAEAALSYLIPIKRGRFGFLKGGYRYAHLKKDKDAEMLSTTMDGAFIQIGFIF